MASRPARIDLAIPPATFSVTGDGFANLGFWAADRELHTERGGLGPGAGDRDDADVADRAIPDERDIHRTGPARTLGQTVVAQVHLQTGPANYSVLGGTAITVTDTRPAPGVSGITPSTIELATRPGHVHHHGRRLREPGLWAARS